MAAYPSPLSLSQAEKILTFGQKKFLDDFSGQPSARGFTFGGGTALSAFYLCHRLSYDLDFFTLNEDLWKGIGIWLTQYVKKEKSKLEIQQIQNRLIFNLTFKNKESLKGEMVYFPFQPIAQPKRILGNLKIESFVDIAVNKFHALIQRKELKDYLDLYFIIEKSSFTFSHLSKLVNLKFDIHLSQKAIAFTLAGIKNFDSSPFRLIRPVSFTQIRKFYESQSVQIMRNLLEKRKKDRE